MGEDDGEGDGDGEELDGEALGEADLDGRGDLDGEGSGGDQGDGASPATAVGWLLGDGERLVPVPTEAPPPAGTGALALVNVPVLARGTRGRMACTLPAAITGTLTAAAIATTATAAATRGWPRALLHPASAAAPAAPPRFAATASAPTPRLPASAAVPAHSSSTGSRSPAGSAGSGSSRARASAGPALLDVPPGQVERVYGQPAVPISQQRAEFRTRRPPGARGAQRAEGLFQLAAAARRQGVRLRPGHAEHGGEIGVVQIVPQAKHDGLALFRLELGEGGRDQGSQLGPFGLPFVLTGTGGTGCTFQISRVGRLAPHQRRSAQALAARGREEPGAQAARIGGGAGRRDDERVPRGFRGLGRLAQHPPAVTVNSFRIRVIGSSDPSRVACRKGRDNRAVFHGPHGS